MIDADTTVSYSGTGGNSWIASMWGLIKTEIDSLIMETQTLEELAEVMDNHMRYYNAARRHSPIDF